jgi:hypothetical protein
MEDERVHLEDLFWIWEDNIEMDFKELYQNVFWLIMHQDIVEEYTVVNSVVNRKFHVILGNTLMSWTTIGVSEYTLYWMCLILWSLLYCFSVMWIFF